MAQRLLYALMGLAVCAAAFDRDLARGLLQELVGINTAPAHGSTRAAEAMAAR